MRFSELSAIIGLAGSIATIIGMVIAVAGVCFAWRSIHRSRQSAAASTLLAFNEAVSGGWRRFLSANEDKEKEYCFAEIANILEIACALQLEGVLVGVSQGLLTEYLDGVLEIIEKNAEAKKWLDELSSAETTFKYLKEFQKKRKAENMSH